MLLMIVVLIPKDGGNYQDIGLLNPIWKVIKVVIDNRLKVLKLHNCLRGFINDRGIGTAIMEVKLTQQLAYIDQVLLYGFFMVLRKAFKTMDGKQYLQILKD